MRNKKEKYILHDHLIEIEIFDKPFDEISESQDESIVTIRIYEIVFLY